MPAAFLHGYRWACGPLPRLALIALWIVGFDTGCGRDDIRSYRVPKERSQPGARAAMPEGHPDVAEAAVGPRVGWKTPAGWKETPTGEMRVASFSVTDGHGKQADVSVIPLSGTGGGDLGNVNRWRGQVGQPPVTEAELGKIAETIEVGGRPAALFDQSGKSAEDEPTRILAVIQHRDGTAWFFKMTGDEPLVAREKTAFIEFLRSFQFTSEASPMAQVSPAADDAGKPEWSVPPGWREVPGGQFLVAKFVIEGEGNAQAAVNVSASAGDGGGVAANVNRWRNQVGLREMTAEELAREVRTVETPEGRIIFVDLAGKDARTGQPAAVVGALVMQPGKAWFYKLMGDPPVVAAQKDEFTRFVQEVRY